MTEGQSESLAPVEEGAGVSEDSPSPQDLTAEQQPASRDTSESLPPSPLGSDGVAPEGQCDFRCQAAEQRELDDLAAQESMARSTENLLGLTFWQTVIGGLGLVAIIITILLTIRATNAAIEANKIARESAEVQLRAYIALQQTIWSAPKEDTPPGSKTYRFQIEWKNCGATPARSCQVSINREIRVGLLPENFEYPQIQGGDEILTERTTLGPGQGCFSSLLFSQEEVRAVASGQSNLFVWAWFEYDDAFKSSPRRRTEICMKVNISPGLKHASSIAFGPHNGVDEGCRHKPKTA